MRRHQTFDQCSTEQYDKERQLPSTFFSSLPPPQLNPLVYNPSSLSFLLSFFSKSGQMQYVYPDSKIGRSAGGQKADGGPLEVRCLEENLHLVINL